MGYNDFSGGEDEFAIGSMYGLRAFHWHRKVQRLTGLSMPLPWADGENTAECFCSDHLPRKHRPGCQIGLCGFYAYTTLERQFTGHVDAIVEAYGLVTIGTLGFRAEKARIVAYVERPRHLPFVPKWLSNAVLRVASKVAGDWQGATMSAIVGGVLVTLAGGVLGILDSAGVVRVPDALLGASTAGLVCSVVLMVLVSLHIAHPLRPSDWDAIRREYPSAKRYRHLTDMVFDYPPGPHLDPILRGES